jgi:hypothetical protein
VPRLIFAARSPNRSAPPAAANEATGKGNRDRAVLSTSLFHPLRREELSKLKVKDSRHMRRGVSYLYVSGKGNKTGMWSYIPLPTSPFTITPRPPGTARATTARCSARSATTAPASATRR